MLVGGAKAQKTDYKAYFGAENSSTEFTVTAGGKFVRPVLSVTDGSKSLRSKFSYRWYIDGKTDENLVEVNGKKSTIDDVTGSSVQYLYGVVTIGNRTGTFKVNVVLTPVDKTKYVSKTVSFTVNVKAPELSYSVTQGTQKLTDESTLTLNTYNKSGVWESVSMALPKVAVTSTVDKFSSDVSKNFDVKYSFADGNQFTVNNEAGTFSSTAGENAASGTMTITVKPKNDGKVDWTKTYGDITKTFTVKVKSEPLKDNNTIATTFSFPERVEEHVRYYRVKKNGTWDWEANPIPVQRPVIRDTYGNDVSYAYNFTLGYYKGDEFVESNQIPGQNVYKKYSGNPLDDYPEGGSKWDGGWHYSAYDNDNPLICYNNFEFGNNTVRVTDDYIVAVKATVKDDYKNIYAEPSDMTKVLDGQVNGMLYGEERKGEEKQNFYKLHNNEYVYRALKHAPQLDFTPDPSTVDIPMANGFELNPTNRFILEGVFKYPVKFGAPVETDSLLYRKSEFWYCFFVPDVNDYNKLSDEKKAEVSAAGYEGPTYINVISGYQPDPKEVYQNVYELGDNGKPNTDSETGKLKTNTVHGTRYFSERGFGNDNLKVIFYGQGYLPMYYNIIPWNNHWDIGTSQLVAMHIVDNEPTHLVISPDTIYTNTNVMSAAPSVKVVDMYGKDVSAHFDITPTKANDADSYNLENTDENGNKYRVTPWQPGEYKVTVTATKRKDDTSKFNNPENGTYTVIATGSTDGNDGKYEVIYDKSEFGTNGLDDYYDADSKSYVRNKSKMGKLHFIKAGAFQPSTISFQEVPGVNITFGTVSEFKNSNKYTVVAQSTTKGDELVDNDNDITDPDDKTDVKRMYLQIGAFRGDNQGKPASGFIRIDAITNGYLTVDAIFQKTGVGEDKIQQYILYDMTATGSDNQLLTSDVDFTGEKQFPLPLIAGHSYALYTDGTMLLHGLSFDPAFIALETDHTPWHSSVTFANGYTGSLPRLRPATAVNTVNYYAKDVKTNETSAKVEDVTDGYHLTIDASTGVVKAKKITGDGTLKMTNASNSEMDDRVTIVASVKGIKHTDGNQVEKRPHYNLFIGNMPIYQVKEGDTYDPGERFSTTNIPTRIWMTIGGWENTNQEEFPYYKNNDIKRQQQNALADAWKVAKMDSVGRDNMTVDNFNFHSTGVQNPTDEVVSGWNSTKTLRLRGGKYISVNNDLGSHTYNVPVRGTYLKFEPQESGRLFVYVLQNGMTDISNADVEANSKRKDDSEDYYLRRRATYIVDETGNNVAIDDDNTQWEGMGSYLSESDDNFKGYNPPHRNYYTDGMLRCSWSFGTGLKFDEREGSEPKYSWRSAYENTGKDANKRVILTDKGQQDYNADKTAVENWWSGKNYTGGTDKLNGPLEIIKLSDGGYVAPTKGYVRYTFDVKAGKTYYLFTTGSKTGFCGFGFLPEGYTKESNATQWINAGNGKSLNETKTAFESSVYDLLPDVSSTVYVSETDKDGYKYGGDEVDLKAKLQSTEVGSYEKLKSDLAKRSFVNVKLYRTLRNKRWNGICLPFSVSETQVKEIFGENSSVITFDSVRADRHGVNPETGEEEDHYRTVHFTRHVSQVIEAGRPYFIYPDVDGKNDGDPLGTKDGDDYYIEFKHVTFEGKKAMIDKAYNDVVADYNNANPDKKIDIFTYKATGIYDCTQVPYYSYYMKAGQDDNNGLSRIVPSKTNPVNDKPLLVGYNTYLYPFSNDAEGKTLVTTEDASSTAKMASFWITGSSVNGGDVTAIDELVQYVNVEQTSFIGGVYTIDGYKVRSDNSLDGLLPGVYVMGGKKYTVK
ncbi:hypothetical protein PRLR6025_12870 [Prevotella lacticifex]|nr:hypothetical protein PRLR6025_12870 [Prevotella lacticifex]